MYVTCIVCIRDVTRSFMGHVSFIYVRWLFHMCDSNTYASFICGIRLCVVVNLYEHMNVRRSYSIWMYECASLLLYINTYVSFICGIFSYRITSTQIQMNVPQTHIHIECQRPVRPTKWHAWWHFRKLPRGVTFSKTLSKLIAQSSNVSFLWNVTKETFDLWALSFERAFENFIPRGIGCIFEKDPTYVCMYVYTYIYICICIYINIYICVCI